MSATTNQDRYASFEWRGPLLSLSRVQDGTMTVIKPQTDWSDVVGDKPLIDNRNRQMADLFPSARGMLARGQAMLDGQQEQTAPEVKIRRMGM